MNKREFSEDLEELEELDNLFKRSFTIEDSDSENELIKLSYTELYNYNQENDFNNLSTKIILTSRLNEYIDIQGHNDLDILLELLEQYDLLDEWKYVLSIDKPSENKNFKPKKMEYLIFAFNNSYLKLNDIIMYIDEIIFEETNTDKDLIILLNLIRPNVKISDKLYILRIIIYKNRLELLKNEMNYFKYYYIVYWAMIQILENASIECLKYLIKLAINFNYNLIEYNKDILEGFIWDDDILLDNPELCLNIDIYSVLLNKIKEYSGSIEKRFQIFYLLFNYTKLPISSETYNLYRITIKSSMLKTFYKNLLKEPLWSESYFETVSEDTVSKVKIVSEDTVSKVKIVSKDIVSKVPSVLKETIPKVSEDNISFIKTITYIEDNDYLKPIITLNTGEQFKVGIKLEKNIYRIGLEGLLIYLGQDIENHIKQKNENYINIVKYRQFLYLVENNFICSFEKLFRYYENTEKRFSQIDIYPTTQNIELNNIISYYHL